MHLWNALPLNVKQIKSHVAFKLKVRTFLWEQLFNNQITPPEVHHGLKWCSG